MEELTAGGPNTPPGGGAATSLPPGAWAGAGERDVTRGQAVTYHRVSTIDQDPALARDELRGAAAALRLRLVGEVEETGSGARNDRPGLQRVLELARRHLVTHVLVWKLDRFGRSSIDVLMNVRELVRAGVTFLATTQKLEVGPDSGPMGNLVLAVMAAMAEFEREIIRERTRLGLAGARARGRKLGRPLGSKDRKQRRRRRR
jgi:putative DNA-invertase from lambdoid prophage Rac